MVAALSGRKKTGAVDFGELKSTSTLLSVSKPLPLFPQIHTHSHKFSTCSRVASLSGDLLHQDQADSFA